MHARTYIYTHTHTHSLSAPLSIFVDMKRKNTGAALQSRLLLFSDCSGGCPCTIRVQNIGCKSAMCSAANQQCAVLQSAMFALCCAAISNVCIVLCLAAAHSLAVRLFLYVCCVQFFFYILFTVTVLVLPAWKESVWHGNWGTWNNKGLRYALHWTGNGSVVCSVEWASLCSDEKTQPPAWESQLHMSTNRAFDLHYSPGSACAQLGSAQLGLAQLNLARLSSAKSALSSAQPERSSACSQLSLHSAQLSLGWAWVAASTSTIWTRSLPSLLLQTRHLSAMLPDRSSVF